MFAWLSGKTVKNPELKEAESVFTVDELKLIQNRFQEEVVHHDGLSAGRSARTQRDSALDSTRLGSLLGPAVWASLDPIIAAHLQLLLADPADGRVRLASLVIAKARAERLGEQAAMDFSFRLISADGGAAEAETLQAAVASCLRMTGAVHGGTSGPAASNSSSSHDQSSNGRSTGIVLGDIELHIAAICQGVLKSHGASVESESEAADGTATGCFAVKNGARLSRDQYCKWTAKCPALHRTLCSVLRGVGAPITQAVAVATTAGPTTADAAIAAAGGVLASMHGGGSGGASVPPVVKSSAGSHLHGQLPALRQLGKLSTEMTLLQPAWTWALSSRLPATQRSEWRLLFNSQRDGKSFSTFFGRVSASPGPSLLLIRDKTGALFGGYASQPWAKSGTFYGDVSCFIFSLLPVFKVFPATGINGNLQWCGAGFSQLPGGIGWGGAAAACGHFALYIEPSLDSGMSRPIATYGNTPLASEQVFQIDTVECWLLQPPEEEPSDAAAGGGSGVGRKAGGGVGGGGSVLSKAAEDRVIMELAGMKMHSAGLRDEPLEEG